MKKRFGLIAVFGLLAAVLTSCATKYTIEFVEKNGTEIFEPIQVGEGKEIVLPENPTKDGLTFDGWYLDPGFKEEFLDTVMPAESLVLYAKWVATLTFDSKGGTEHRAITNTPGAYATLPEPTKDGYVFAGWYSDEACTVEQKPVVPNKHTTVYAKWQVKNSNTYYPLNNWRDNDGNAYNIVKDAEGTTITATENKGSWAFAYDLINIDGTGFRVVELVFEGTKDCEAVIKLEGGDAQAVETRVKFTGEEQTLTWVVKANQITTVPGQKLMIFLNAGNKGHVQTPGAEGAEDVKFASAPYIKIKSSGLYQPQDIGAVSNTYAIHFDSNGGSTMPSIYAEAGNNVTAAEPTKEGYVFAGWYTDAACTKEFDGKMPAAATILYAKWDEAYDAINGGFVCDNVVQVEKEEKAIEYAYADGALTVKKTAIGGEWTCIMSKEKGNVLEGATKCTVVLTGTEGKQVLVKINDQYETWVTCTGAEQTVEIDLTGKTFDANRAAMLLFPEGGKATEGAEFVIKSITFNTATPVDFAAKEYTCGDNYQNTPAITATYNKGVLTIVKLPNGEEWACTKSVVIGKDIAGAYKLVATIKGVAGSKILFKVNDQYETWVECTGAEQTVEIDFSHITVNAKGYALVLFPEGGSWGTGAKFEISQLAFIKKAELANDTFTCGDNTAEKTAVEIATVDGVLTLTKTEQGGDWTNVASVATGAQVNGYTHVRVVVKGPEGKKILVKVNNSLEVWVTCTGAEQVVDIDLSELKVNKTAPAMLFFPEGGSVGTGAKFEISSIEYSNYVVVDVPAVSYNALNGEFVNNEADATSVAKTADGSVSIAKTATEGHEWSFVKTADMGNVLEGFTMVTATISGTAGEKILVKVNDRIESMVTIAETDVPQQVVINIEGLSINANAPAVLFFPGAGVAGATGQFVVSQLVYSTYKVSTSILGEFVCNDADATTATVNADGSVSLAKVATEGYEWTFIKTAATGAVLEGYNKLIVTVSGVAGEKILFKVNDRVETMVTIAETNVPQTAVVNYEGLEINPAVAAVLIFPGAGVAGATGQFVISEMILSNVNKPLSALEDTYTELDKDTYTFTLVEGKLQVQKVGTGAWQFAVGSLKGADIVGYTTLTATVTGVAGQKITLKVNDKLEYPIEFTAETLTQTVVINIKDLEINEAAAALVLFVNGGVEAASEVFEFSQLTFGN